MNLSTYVGDSLRISGAVRSRLDSGDPLDLTGATITVTLRGVTGVPPSPVTITKEVGTGVTVTDAESGFFYVDLTPDDTEALGVDGGTFDYSIRISESPTLVHTVTVGKIKVLPSL